MILFPSLSAWLRVLAGSRAARPLRFVLVGGTAALVQLAVLAFLTRHGWNALPAEVVGFLVAAQINFVLSVTLTWRDRAVGQSWPQRWLLFHVSISLMAAVNVATFALTRSVLPTLTASLAGSASGAIGNYFIGDRLVFRGPSGRGNESSKGSFAA
jgi:putative flippase GtrA